MFVQKYQFHGWLNLPLFFSRFQISVHIWLPLEVFGFQHTGATVPTTGISLDSNIANWNWEVQLSKVPATNLAMRHHILMNFSTVIYLLGSGSTKSGQDIDLENVFFLQNLTCNPKYISKVLYPRIVSNIQKRTTVQNQKNPSAWFQQKLLVGGFNPSEKY